MKKEKNEFKSTFKEALWEGLLEILLTLVFFGIGALVVCAFGVKIDSARMDFELLVVLGMIVLFVAVGLVCALVHWLKRKRKDK